MTNDFVTFPEIIAIDQTETSANGLIFTTTLLDADGQPVKVKTTTSCLIRYGHFRRAAKRQTGINLRHMPAETWRHQVQSFVKRRRTA